MKNDSVPLVVDLIRQLKCQCRVKSELREQPSDWDWPLFVPTAGYLETGSLGPVTLSEVEWIEIDPVVMTHIGVRVASKRESLRQELLTRLAEAKVEYEIAGSIVRVS